MIFAELLHNAHILSLSSLFVLLFSTLSVSSENFPFSISKFTGLIIFRNLRVWLLPHFWGVTGCGIFLREIIFRCFVTSQNLTISPVFGVWRVVELFYKGWFRFFVTSQKLTIIYLLMSFSEIFGFVFGCCSCAFESFILKFWSLTLYLIVAVVQLSYLFWSFCLSSRKMLVDKATIEGMFWSHKITVGKKRSILNQLQHQGWCCTLIQR